jgi:hypothetical protein
LVYKEDKKEKAKTNYKGKKHFVQYVFEYGFGKKTSAFKRI